MEKISWEGEICHIGSTVYTFRGEEEARTRVEEKVLVLVKVGKKKQRRKNALRV